MFHKITFKSLRVAIVSVCLVGALSLAWGAEHPIGSQDCVRERLALKLYTDGYTSYDFDQSPITNGLEVEGHLPARVGFKSVIRNMMEYLRSKGLTDLSVKHSIDKYGSYGLSDAYRFHWMKNGHPYDMELKEDFSVRAPVGFMPLEIASPIVRNESDYEDFAGVLEILRKLGVVPRLVET
jgi:hypothetical protein